MRGRRRLGLDFVMGLAFMEFEDICKTVLEYDEAYLVV